MALKKVGTFIISDSSLDRHGERILAEGMNLTKFKQNPVMFYNHKRSDAFGEKTFLPIGVWKGVKVEDGKIKASAYIDEGDDFAKEIGRKISLGIIKSASVGIAVKAISDAEEDKLKGQTGVTITKSELREVSIVDIPANPNAKLLSKIYAEKKAEGEQIDFDNTTTTKTAFLEIIPEVKSEDNNKKTKYQMKDFNIIEWVKGFFSHTAENEEAAIKFVEGQKPLAEQITAATTKAVDEAKSEAQKSYDDLKAQFDELTIQKAELEERVTNIENAVKGAEQTEVKAETAKTKADVVATQLDKLTEMMEVQAKAATTKAEEEKTKAAKEIEDLKASTKSKLKI